MLAPASPTYSASLRLAERHLGLGAPEEFDLPITQDKVADATGMTSVHVNRTLRALREEGALVIGGPKVRIADWNLLQQIAGFDQAYLHCAA